jgi:spore coat protein JB
MFFDDNNLDLITLFKSGNDNKMEILDSKEGFLKGNMFKCEYLPYKSYKCAELHAASEKQAYLFRIMELNFAVNDLNLYLDLHPDDNEVYTLLKKYTELACQVEGEYVKKYGPLEVDNTYSCKDEWINGWPWDKEDAYYV